MLAAWQVKNQLSPVIDARRNASQRNELSIVIHLRTMKVISKNPINHHNAISKNPITFSKNPIHLQNPYYFPKNPIASPKTLLETICMVINGVEYGVFRMYDAVGQPT